MDIPPQEILTKDSVTVAVDAVVYYNIKNPLNAIINVENYAKSTKLLASTTLRTILGTRSLSEILSDRENIANGIMNHLEEATDNWGIEVYTNIYLHFAIFPLKMEIIFYELLCIHVHSNHQ